MRRPNLYRKTATKKQQLEEFYKSHKVSFRPIEVDDDIYTIKEFISDCKWGLLTDYDGFGEYVDGDKVTNIRVYPSDVPNNYHKFFDGVCWYNR